MPNNSKFDVHLKRNEFLLFVCGAVILYWELVLIRWMGSCIRIISYFSNFILVAAFLGLGAGALLARRKFNLGRLMIPSLSICLILAPFLGLFGSLNPTNANEFVWIGGPLGVNAEFFIDRFLGMSFEKELPFWIILPLCFIINTWLFLILGQKLGILFGKTSPLKAYSIEIGGSIFGILLFGMISFLNWPPTLWFAVGYALIFLLEERKAKVLWVSLASAVIALVLCGNFERNFIWSPYYKITVAPLRVLVDKDKKTPTIFSDPFGHKISVNNDYHQMIINLSPKTQEHDFFKSWRKLYDYPYQNAQEKLRGPVLIVGGGTGNDASAALRAGIEEVVVVEIDPQIIRLGKKLHPESPYSNNRVKIINDDARSYLARTDKKFAMVVMGFLDSHTLLSSFSSVRLDNFVYTREAMEKIKEVLLPGGKVFLTFATNRDWIHNRLIKMLDSVFDFKTISTFENDYGYSNGYIYENGKSAEPENLTDRPASSAGADIKIPTDDWPFLYMKAPSVPAHYIVFIVLVLLMSMGSLYLLPAPERKIKFKYFFMGAGFFLIETSNIIKLSLLYGSTWIVNITVFSGILLLILIGNLVSVFIKGDHYPRLFAVLLLFTLISYGIKPSYLLAIDLPAIQGILAVTLFLGPVFFASVIFAKMIRKEEKLYAAYGSNLLGAMVGGASEYLSIALGFQSLILISIGFYFLAYYFVCHREKALGV